MLTNFGNGFECDVHAIAQAHRVAVLKWLMSWRFNVSIMDLRLPMDSATSDDKNNKTNGNFANGQDNRYTWTLHWVAKLAIIHITYFEKGHSDHEVLDL